MSQEGARNAMVFRIVKKWSRLSIFRVLNGVPVSNLLLHMGKWLLVILVTEDFQASKLAVMDSNIFWSCHVDPLMTWMDSSVGKDMKDPQYSLYSRPMAAQSPLSLSAFCIEMPSTSFNTF